MILLSGVAALVVLALITQAGVFALQRIYPQQGRSIDVAGARLNVVDLGPRDAAGPPIVMIHGASSNLESMRPLGDLLAKHHRVILIDRPGHGWSTRDDLENSTPAMQARMIDEALEKLGVERRDRRGAFARRRAGCAAGAGLSAARRGSGDAGAGGLSVARRRRMVQQGRHHAGDRPAARLYDHAAARSHSVRTRRAQRVRAADHAGGFCQELSHAACCCGRANFSPTPGIW